MLLNILNKAFSKELLLKNNYLNMELKIKQHNKYYFFLIFKNAISTTFQILKKKIKIKIKTSKNNFKNYFFIIWNTERKTILNKISNLNITIRATA